MPKHYYIHCHDCHFRRTLPMEVSRIENVSSPRQIMREAAAEFTGVMLLGVFSLATILREVLITLRLQVIFGSGVNCQVGLSSNPAVPTSPKGNYLSVSFGWAVGVSIAVWVSAGISGGHVNPAVTVSLAIFRGFPWKKVPIYAISQVLGGIVGAAMYALPTSQMAIVLTFSSSVYANNFHAIDMFEGGRGVRTLATAGFFGTFAADYLTDVSCFFSEFLATAILILVILAVTDKHNSPPPCGLLPLVLFVLILGIAASLGINTSFAINPARDLGARILTSMVGYGSAVYTYRNQYWIWGPILGPFLGAIAGACFYDILLFDGDENIFKRRAQTPDIVDKETNDV
ncbi:hypothetical protein VNI00_010115 [Paramarasmius palmivorus]|uniref:Aquaporin n=1 Tax=Paramarasmius palmivorus TaxID=297713 RepID=A0AAW0CJQ9_9AGAR